MESILHVVTDFMSDIRKVKLVCRSWYEKILENENDYIDHLLSLHPGKTLYEISEKYVAANNIYHVGKIVNLRYHPIQWDWLVFSLHTVKMFHVIRCRLSPRYRYLAASFFTAVNVPYRDSLAIFFTAKEVRKFLIAVLNNNIAFIRKLTATMQLVYVDSIDIYRFIQRYGSPEVLKILGIERKHHTANGPKPTEYPFPLKDRSIATLVKHDRIDILDMMLANRQITLEQIQQEASKGDGVSDRMWEYIVHMSNQ